MSQLNNGPITSNDLMQRLVQAKKVLNKVDSGNYQKGNIDESMINRNDDYDDYDEIPVQTPSTPNMRSVSQPMNADRIQNSKLPDAIKKAMMENPISQISLNDTLDMDFVKGAKRLMEAENAAARPPQAKKSTQQIGGNIDMNAIATLIENTVRKVMDEKLNQILSASTTQSINENLVLKVGDSIFKGKITGVNKSK
jgi:hypothetical protein